MIQWFPGHMAKAKKEIAAVLPLVDIIFELVDARIPYSSQNPLFLDLIKNKPRLVLLTKSEMADVDITEIWVKRFEKSGAAALAVDAVSGYNVNRIAKAVRNKLRDKIIKKQIRGMKMRPTRAMIIGIPNVGKSTLINKLVRKRATAVGNRPGVTKAQQWIRINPQLELLDTPGMLWPKIKERTVAIHLALTGAIKSEIVPFIDIGEYFFDFFRGCYSELFTARYGVDLNLSNQEIAKAIVTTRGIIREDYYEKAFNIVINDFQNMRIGRITLDRP